MYGPHIKEGKRKRQAMLCDCIDDHSRVLVGAFWSFSESAASLERMLKSAITRFGLPEILYVDYTEKKQMPKFKRLPCLHKKIA